jgi:hypothetical protein
LLTYEFKAKWQDLRLNIVVEDLHVLWIDRVSEALICYREVRLQLYVLAINMEFDAVKDREKMALAVWKK